MRRLPKKGHSREQVGAPDPVRDVNPLLLAAGLGAWLVLAITWMIPEERASMGMMDAEHFELIYGVILQRARTDLLG